MAVGPVPQGTESRMSSTQPLLRVQKKKKHKMKKDEPGYTVLPKEPGVPGDGGNALGKALWAQEGACPRSMGLQAVTYQEKS